MQKAIDKRKALALVFVGLRKAFDTPTVKAVINLLIKLGCSWNLDHSPRSPLDTPFGTNCVGKDCFIMQRGVRQGPKEGPLLFNVIFQMILEEAL